MTETQEHWLDELEEKVHAAVAALRELRKENQRLVKRARELEDRLAKAETASEDGEGAWEAERREIRERVEKLKNRLEELLEG